MSKTSVACSAENVPANNVMFRSVNAGGGGDNSSPFTDKDCGDRLDADSDDGDGGGADDDVLSKYERTLPRI